MHSFLWLVILTLSSVSCNKNIVQPRSEFSKLPPATQTGQRTFGCLIDGKAFVVKNRTALEGPDIHMYYEFTDGGYYFNIKGSNKNADGSITAISLGTNSLTISEGQTLKLVEYAPGQASAAYSIINLPVYNYLFQTSQAFNGELKITKLDSVNGIVSGTFTFDVLDNNNKTVKITDGRFDTVY